MTQLCVVWRVADISTVRPHEAVSVWINGIAVL